MPNDEETAPDPEEAEEILFLEEHAEDDTMTQEEEEAIKEDQKNSPGPVPEEVS